MVLFKGPVLMKKRSFQKTGSMKKNLLLGALFLLPYLSNAQEQYVDMLATDVVDETTHDIIKSSYWQVLERGSFSRNLNTFYRISSVNGKFYLDLKVIHGGDIFVVPRNGELMLWLENGDIVTLYNTAYKTTSIGAGARKWAGSGAEGMTVTYRITENDIKQLLHNYIARIKFCTGDGYVEKRITEYHSEVFMDEVALVYYAQ